MALNRPTIIDVARRAGVSLSTVSLVINKSQHVSKETSRKVQRVIEELGYHPTRSARGLASKTSGNIGFILREDHFSQAEPFYTKIFLGSEFAAREHNYYILLTTVGSRFNETRDIPRFLLERNVDGLIVAGKVNVRLVERFEKFGLPIVLVDYEVRNKPYSAVLIDNRGGARAAVNHLVTQGHRDIAFVGGDMEHPSLAGRLEGYREALAEYDIKVCNDLVDVREQDTRVANGAQAMKRLLHSQRRLSAVFAINDAMAIGCVREIKESGLRVPADVAVAGFDDIEMCVLIEPHLTTMHVWKEELGRLAVSHLVDTFKSTSPRTVTTVVPVELVVRESTVGNHRTGILSMPAD